MAVQLSSSYLRRSFQLLAYLSPDAMSDEEAFERASNIIYEWAKHKFSNIFKQMPYFKESLDDKRDGNEIGIIYEPENSRFIFRGVHPDAYVPGRIWTTDAQVSKYNNKYLFAVRLSVTSLQSCVEDVPFSCPQFVQYIIETIGISDVVRISGKPHMLSNQEHVTDFVNYLENPERQMPVILLTPCYCNDDAVCDGYMTNSEQMAKDLRGVAQVFCIDLDANDYLTECIGKQWSAYNGAIRTYYPNLSFEESDLYQHPLLTPQNIRVRRIKDDGESDAWIHDIEDYVQGYAVKRRVPWEDNGIDFYLSAHQNKLREQRIANAQSQEELISLYEEQIEQMQKQSEEYLFLADSYAKDYEECSTENDQQRQLISRLKAQMANLRSMLQAAVGNTDGRTIPVNGSYSEMADWVEEYYPDKLQFHARAIRSLKNACYEDTELVYKCLKLLATSYYDYRTGLITNDDFMKACKEVDSGLDERGAITDVAAGMEGDTYYVHYRGKKRKLERHLTKGSSKDRRRCLRIYFFWDEQEQVVVIGDLPHHLDTSAT